jgi:lysozyme family protein
MGAIFDAYYHVGLGFKNELDLEHKKFYKIPDYPRSFELNELNGDIIEMVKQHVKQLIATRPQFFGVDYR